MYDKTLNKKFLICHRTFNLKTVDSVGFSDQDVKDSKAYFKLFERFRKFNLNPVVALKRLPRNHSNSGNVPLEMGPSVKRRCSRRVTRSLTAGSQSRTRQEEEEEDDEEENNDIGCSPVQSSPEIEIDCSSIKSQRGKMDEGVGEKIVLARKVTATKTNIRKWRAKTVLRPKNHEVIHSSGSVELTVEHKLDDVVDRINRQNGTSQGSLLEKRTNGIKTRTASNGLESSKRFEKPWPPKIDEYPEELGGSVGSPRDPAETILERVKTSPNSTACKAKFRRMPAENVRRPMSHEVIHSSGSVDLFVEHKASDMVLGIGSKESSPEGSLLKKRSNGIKTRRVTTGIESSEHLEKSPPPKIDDYLDELREEDRGIGSSVVLPEMICKQLKTAPAQNSTVCKAQLGKRKGENLLRFRNHETIHSSGSVELIVEHKFKDVVNGIDSKQSPSKGFLLDKLSNGIKNRKASAGLTSSEHLWKSLSPKIGECSEGLDGSISSPRVPAEMVLERVETIQAENSTACKAELGRTQAEGASLLDNPEEVLLLSDKRSKKNCGRKSEDKHSLNDGKSSGEVEVGFESASHELDDSSLKLRSCCGDVLCNCLVCWSSRQIPNQPTVKTEMHSQTKYDASVYLKLTGNTSLPIDDDIIRTAKFIEHEKSNYDLADELLSLPKIELTKLPLTSGGERETNCMIVGTNRCADFNIESQPPKSAKESAVLPREEWFERRNSYRVPSSPIFKTKKRNHQLESSTDPLNGETIGTLQSLTQDSSKNDSSNTMGSQSISPEETMNLSLPQFEKIWTILKPCVVRLERVSDLDNLVKKHSMNVCGMRMVYKYRHIKYTPAIYSKPTSEGHVIPRREFDEKTEKSAADSREKNESTYQIGTQKKIDLSDGLALKEFCQLESIVIEDSDTELEVEGQMERASPPGQCDKQSTSPITILPAVGESLGDINSVESLHDSDLLQNEPFEIEKERLCDSIWSDVLDFGGLDESEIEDVSALQGKFRDPLPLISHDRLSVRLGEVGSIADTPDSRSIADTPGIGFIADTLAIGSIADTPVSESSQQSFDAEDLELALNNDLEQRVKRFCQDVLDPSPEKSNTTDSSVHNSLNSESSSPPAESKSPVCSKSPPKIRLKVARKRGKTAKDDVSYTYSYGENSESVSLPEYGRLTRRPFKRVKLTDKNISNTIVDHDLSDLKSSVKDDDSSTPIKVEKRDQHDQAVGQVCDNKTLQVPTNANPYHELSTIPYILKCNLQNRCRKCKNLNPCANANKKFKLFYALNIGAGRRLSQPLLDALRNREDPCEIDRTSAHIAASAVLEQSCTILVPATPELIQILLPPHRSNMIMELVYETNEMESKVRKSIQASAFAEALQVKRAIIAKKTKTPSNQEIDDIRPVIFHKILSERPFLPYRSNQIIATKSKIDNKIKFVRKCMLPVMPKDSKVVLYPSKEAGDKKIEYRKKVSIPQEKCLDGQERKDDRSLSDVSESASLIAIRNTPDESTPRLHANVSLGTAEISSDVSQPSSLGNGFCRSSPLKRTVSFAEPDSVNRNESVQRKPKNRALESSSGVTISNDLGSEPGNRRIARSSSTGLSEERVDDGTDENVSDSRLCGVSHVGEGLASDAIIESSSPALVSFSLPDPHEPPVDPILNGITNELHGDPVLPENSKRSSKGSAHSDFVLTQTDTGDLIIPFDIMADEPTSVQELNNKVSSGGPGEWLLTLPPLIPPTIPSKVTESVPLESQVPDADSSAQKDRNPSSLQLTSCETPDVIIVPDKFESIDLTVCEEENQSIRKAATINSTSTKRTFSIPAINMSPPISREPIPEWGVICSSLPILGYVKVQKVGSKLVIYDNSVVLVPLGFPNIHELNGFLNSQLADISFSYRKKVALEWIMVTAGYLKMKAVPPTNPQFWQDPSTAAETQKAIRECLRKDSINKLEASKRLKASQNKANSSVSVSTCSVTEKKGVKTKPSPQNKSMARANNQRLSKKGKAVRINGQLVSMGTPVAYSQAPTSPNVDTEGTSSTPLSLSGGIVASATHRPVSAATLITSASKASSDLVNQARKKIETRARLGSLVKSVSQGSVGSSGVSMSPEEHPRMVFFGSQKAAHAPTLPTIGKTLVALPPMARSSASSKTVRPTSSVSLATRMVSTTINPTRQTSTPYRQSVVTPGSVKRIVLSSAACAPNNAKSMANTITTTTKRTSLAIRPNPIATATKTSTATSLLVQNQNVQIPSTHQSKTLSYSGPTGVGSSHRPILILRKGAQGLAPLPAKNSIRALLRNNK